MSNTLTVERPADVRQRVRILNLDIDAASMNEVGSMLEKFVEENKPRHVVTVNLQFLSTARGNKEFAEQVNDADLVVADGMPLVWMSKIQGTPIASRITGHDLLNYCAALAHEKGHSIFLLGGAPGSAEDAIKKLRTEYPGLKVEGTHHGFFSSDGMAERQDELSDRIRAFGPQFLFVGLGCPKQEVWIRRHMHDLGVPVCVGVGGTFEIFTGRLKRAPAWMQQLSLEWVYRLLQEPRRLWKRYILADIPTTFMATTLAIAHKVSAIGR